MRPGFTRDQRLSFLSRSESDLVCFLRCSRLKNRWWCFASVYNMKQSLFNGVSSKDLQKARRIAKRNRTAVSCLRCKKSKVKCSDYRPCPRCVDANDAERCISGIQAFFSLLVVYNHRFEQTYRGSHRICNRPGSLTKSISPNSTLGCLSTSIQLLITYCWPPNKNRMDVDHPQTARPVRSAIPPFSA